MLKYLKDIYQVAYSKGGNFCKLINSLTAYFSEFKEFLVSLKAEIDPRTSTLFLPLWEEVLGLPDGIYPVASTIAERRLNVYKKLTARLTSEQSWVDFAKDYGVEITIEQGSEYAFFPLKFPIVFSPTPKQARNTTIIYIKSSLSSDYLLPLGFPVKFAPQNQNIDFIKKILNKAKPAQTQLIFKNKED